MSRRRDWKRRTNQRLPIIGLTTTLTLLLAFFILIHHFPSQSISSKTQRSSSSRILHSDPYMAWHRPCPPQASTAPEISTTTPLSTITPSIRDGGMTPVENTSIFDHSIDRIETALLDSDEIPNMSDHTQHHRYHNHQHALYSSRPELSRRATLSHPFRWVRHIKTSSSDSSSIPPSADIGHEAEKGGLKIKLKIKRVKRQGMHVIHELFGRSKTWTATGVNLEEDQPQEDHQYHVGPWSAMMTEEHEQIEPLHPETEYPCTATSVDPVPASTAYVFDDSERWFTSTAICCPLPVDELAPDSPLLCSSPMMDVEPIGFWSLDQAIAEEMNEQSDTVEVSSLQEGAWTINEAQSVQVQSLEPILQPTHIISLPEDILALFRHDTLDWYGHLYLQHILSKAIDMLVPSCYLSGSKMELELTIHLEELTESSLTEGEPSVLVDSSSSSSLPPDIQVNEESPPVDLSSPMETLEREIQAKEPAEDDLCGMLCITYISAIEHSSDNKRGDESGGHSTVPNMNDIAKTIVRRRMSLPVLLYRRFKPFQLLSHKGGSYLQVRHPISVLMPRSLRGMTGYRKNFFIGNVGLWSSGGL